MDKKGNREYNSTYNLTYRKSDVAYLGFLTLLFALLTELFYRQTICYNDAYISDTIVYAQLEDGTESFRLIAKVFDLLRSINDSTFEIALFMAFVVIMTVIASYYLMKLLLERENIILERWKLQLMSLGALFAGAIYVPGIYEHFYTMTWTRYSWQSPTQQAMVLFSIMSMYFFIKIYDGFEEKIAFKEWAYLMLSLLLSASAKPNFFLCFAPVAGAVFLLHLFKGTKGKSGNRGESWKFLDRLKAVVIFGTAFIPAGLYLIILNSLIFDSDSEGMGIRPGYFLAMADSPVMMILLSLAFTLVVLIFNIKKLKDRAYGVIFWTTCMGIGEYLLLVEEGRRINHGNFGWGREVGQYLLFMMAMVLAIVNFRDSSFLKEKPKLRKVYFILLVILFGAHLISGLVYFQYVVRGHLYRI